MNSRLFNIFVLIAVTSFAACQSDAQGEAQASAETITSVQQAATLSNAPAVNVQDNPTVGAKKLDVNDVTILYPLPRSPQDLSRLINIAELKSLAGEPVFPQHDFEQMVTLAESAASSIGRHRIKLNQQMHEFSAWFIAGIRFDPTAPGSSPEIQAAFGQRPQIRLIVQPVTITGTTVTVHDTAIHLIYDYITDLETATPGSVPKALPDDAAIAQIVADLIDIKARSEALGVPTGGNLSVHPGLSNSISQQAVSEQLKLLLEKYLSTSRFNSGAVMGLANPNPEPWIFLAMTRDSESGKFKPLASPGLGSAATPLPAQLLSFVDTQNVLPAPSTTNRNPITASLLIPQVQRRGVSTAPLFARSPNFGSKATIGIDNNGNPVLDETLTVADIPDWIANPQHSHFFNTDCVSCHTETTRRSILSIPPSPLAFNPAPGVSGLDVSVSPSQNWNVRNLGWFKDKATITERTANETAEVVEWLNKNVIGKD